ncbi:ferric iron reductase protein FhuF [Paenibacillus endophyticus]|uniref:Ferric iron reductase protein FhuF n=1 Tax=Paenibacillus endophyticus TaxID=1294268 RepID=A0A7W5GDD3_9BACL|nr:(2Fe-2S)-binding protein [Paenibacillus endophyticus]MBB3156309.1 ferric iron reductase protein FhuF [Paenibacillus endophyticus]
MNNETRCQIAQSFLQNHFRISVRQPDDEEYSFAVTELLDSVSRTAILDIQSALLSHPDRKVVGTLFAKRYSVWFTGLVAAVGLFDYRLSSNPANVRFHISSQAVMAYQTMPEAQEWLSHTDLAKRRNQLAVYFQELLQNTDLVFASVSEHTSAPTKVMWSLVTHQLLQYYARLEEEHNREMTKERLQLIADDQSILMGCKSEHLISTQLRRVKHPSHGSILYIRRYCCLAFRLKSHGYCHTCPRLSAPDRERMLMQER